MQRTLRSDLRWRRAQVATGRCCARHNGRSDCARRHVPPVVAVGGDPTIELRNLRTRRPTRFLTKWCRRLGAPVVAARSIVVDRVRSSPVVAPSTAVVSSAYGPAIGRRVVRGRHGDGGDLGTRRSPVPIRQRPDRHGGRLLGCSGRSYAHAPSLTATNAIRDQRWSRAAFVAPQTRLRVGAIGFDRPGLPSALMGGPSSDRRRRGRVGGAFRPGHRSSKHGPDNHARGPAQRCAD